MSSSRPYKVTVPPPVTQTVMAEDHVHSTLDLPPVLPPGEMSGLLQAELGRRHFEPNGEGGMGRDRDGVRVEVDPDTGGVKVSVSASADVSLPPPPPTSPCGCRHAQAVAAAAAASDATSAAARRLQEAVTGRLGGAVGKVGCELEGIIWAVLVEALKVKAARLGVVKSVDEDRKTGSLTVVVEV